MVLGAHSYWLEGVCVGRRRVYDDWLSECDDGLVGQKRDEMGCLGLRVAEVGDLVGTRHAYQRCHIINIRILWRHHYRS